MSETFEIRAWSDTFLPPKMRDHKGRMRWVQLPVRLDDIDYRALASRDDGPATLGVWMALIELAGTLERRDGLLARRDGRPLTIEEIVMMVGISKKAVEKAISALSAIGWILVRNDSESFGSDAQRFGTVPPRSGVEGSGAEGSGQDVPGDSAPEKRSARKPSGDVQEILSWFRDEYERTQGTPYVIAAKDAVGVTRLLKVLPADEIRARLLRGLTTAEDDWIAGTDRGLALLVGQINKPALRGTAKPNGRDPKVGYAAPDDRSEFHQTRVVDL